MKMPWYVGPNEECILVRESHWQSMGDVPETELIKGSLREPGVGNKYETSKKKWTGARRKRAVDRKIGRVWLKEFLKDGHSAVDFPINGITL